ncbi:hypothetical protein E1A91_A13G185900v1 [Gossypium mustelinum]|uniref:Uncharacterized protein n=1 Tax=Gossypium mustelinum TaxID=34275 RepID=A0A5D2WJR0_GOSMU|nr:hypothetical protein E1A91_A13G185900v1 [Gossypium mustelinum]
MLRSHPLILYNQTRSRSEGLLVKGCIKIDCDPCSLINMLKASVSLKRLKSTNQSENLN